MANFDHSSFASASPDSGVELESLSQHKFALQYEPSSRKRSTLDQEQQKEPQPFQGEHTQMGYCKFDDPLSEPIVGISLQKVKITGLQLMNMSVKELNKRLAHCPPFIVAKLKKCRRTLKNRGYAKNCRIKRIAIKNQLEVVNNNLVIENRELRQQNKSLTDQLDHLLAICRQQDYRNQNIIGTNENENENQHRADNNSNNYIRIMPDVEMKSFNNQSSGQQREQQSTPSYGINTTLVVNDYNHVYPSTQTVSASTHVTETYYPLEHELDYLAEQLALDQ